MSTIIYCLVYLFDYASFMTTDNKIQNQK